MLRSVSPIPTIQGKFDLQPFPRSGRSNGSHSDLCPVERANDPDALPRHLLQSHQVALKQIDSVAVYEDKPLTSVHASHGAFSGRLADFGRMLGTAARV
jgi:hypothetical protein